MSNKCVCIVYRVQSRPQSTAAHHHQLVSQLVCAQTPLVQFVVDLLLHMHNTLNQWRLVEPYHLLIVHICGRLYKQLPLFVSVVDHDGFVHMQVFGNNDKT